VIEFDLTENDYLLLNLMIMTFINFWILHVLWYSNILVSNVGLCDKCEVHVLA